MKESVIVHGPQACGKTRNGEAIAKKYQLDEVIELEAIGLGHPPTHGALILSNQPVERLACYELTLIPFNVAIQGIKVSA